MANRHHVMRNVSVFYRLTQMYFSDKLKPYNLGSGQQYFLLQISRYPGASLAELADLGAFDNCTVTRAVQKLESVGYIRVERCPRDHRAKRLYLTEEGEALIAPIRSMIGEWMAAVTDGFTEEEKETVGALVGRLADNARAILAERSRPDDGADSSKEDRR
ncbi:MAG: MarR family transcriptional regulator [Clostridia bacterium]|nr:MarR family transcriptional regulator [Clostridia bacterium]